MPGVNVIIKGTYYGSAADLNGNYSIKNIVPGNYDVEVSIIGYKVVLKTGFQVKANEDTTLDFVLEETVLSFGEDVVVLGKKPLFDVDETASVARVRKEDIENKVVSVFQGSQCIYRRLAIESVQDDRNIFLQNGSLFVADDKLTANHSKFLTSTTEGWLSAFDQFGLKTLTILLVMVVPPHSYFQKMSLITKV